MSISPMMTFILERIPICIDDIAPLIVKLGSFLEHSNQDKRILELLVKTLEHSRVVPEDILDSPLLLQDNGAYLFWNEIH